MRGPIVGNRYFFVKQKVKESRGCDRILLSKNFLDFWMPVKKAQTSYFFHLSYWQLQLEREAASYWGLDQD